MSTAQTPTMPNLAATEALIASAVSAAKIAPSVTATTWLHRLLTLGLGAVVAYQAATKPTTAPVGASGGNPAPPPTPAPASTPVADTAKVSAKAKPNAVAPPTASSSTAKADPVAQSTTTASAVSAVAAAPASSLTAVNAARAAKGLTLLVDNAALFADSVANNAQQAIHGGGHYVFPPPPYGQCADAGAKTPADAVTAWENSDAHAAILFGNYAIGGFALDTTTGYATLTVAPAPAGTTTTTVPAPVIPSVTSTVAAVAAQATPVLSADPTVAQAILDAGDDVAALIQAGKPMPGEAATIEAILAKLPMIPASVALPRIQAATARAAVSAAPVKTLRAEAGAK